MVGRNRDLVFNIKSRVPVSRCDMASRLPNRDFSADHAYSSLGAVLCRLDLASDDKTVGISGGSICALGYRFIFGDGYFWSRDDCRKCLFFASISEKLLVLRMVDARDANRNLHRELDLELTLISYNQSSSETSDTPVISSGTGRPSNVSTVGAISASRPFSFSFLPSSPGSATINGTSNVV